MATPLSIIIVDSDPERARTICDGLADLGGARFSVVQPGHGLARRIAALNPDLVLIDADNAARDEMEELTLASGPMERPVAVFITRSDSAMTRAMIEAGVMDGDTVVVRQQPSVEQGEMCAALIDGEATVKFFRRTRAGEVFLDPANERYDPIRVAPGADSSIMGRVVAVLRKL